MESAVDTATCFVEGQSCHRPFRNWNPAIRSGLAGIESVSFTAPPNTARAGYVTGRNWDRARRPRFTCFPGRRVSSDFLKNNREVLVGIGWMMLLNRLHEFIACDRVGRAIRRAASNELVTTRSVVRRRDVVGERATHRVGEWAELHFPGDWVENTFITDLA